MDEMRAADRKRIAENMLNEDLEKEIAKLQETMTLLYEKEAKATRDIQRTMQQSTELNKPEEYSSKFKNDFEINNILGMGAFGIVFEAISILDEWKYAVKRISIDSSEEIVKKALLEVRAMAQFDHPGIVRYHSTWPEEPPEWWQLYADLETLQRYPSFSLMNQNYSSNTTFIYIQMQLCKYSLAEWLNLHHESRDLIRMKSWFRQIVSAVAYIHEQGFIHRDLKPSNILFYEEDHIKICDLGIAKQLIHPDGKEISKIDTSNICTPLYKAPEQDGMNDSFKVDVFTLGLIFTEMCAVMDADERERIFANYRCGKPNDLLQEHPTAAEFALWLADVDQAKRPTSKEVAMHPYLA